MADLEYLLEAEVTPNSLAALFKRAFISTTIDEDEDLLIKIDGITMLIMLYESSKLIKYVIPLSFKESSALHDRIELTEKLNRKIVFARFSISETNPNKLLVEYFLPYEEGVVAYSVVSSARLLAQIAIAAISQYNEHKIIE